MNCLEICYSKKKMVRKNTLQNWNNEKPLRDSSHSTLDPSPDRLGGRSSSWMPRKGRGFKVQWTETDQLPGEPAGCWWLSFLMVKFFGLEMGIEWKETCFFFGGGGFDISVLILYSGDIWINASSFVDYGNFDRCSNGRLKIILTKMKTLQVSHRTSQAD